MSLREQYLNTPTVTTGTADIPEWGTVHLRSLTLSELNRLETAIAKDPAEALAVAVVLGVGDTDGKRVFTDADLGAIRGTGFHVVKAVAEAVVKHNRMNAEVVEEKKGD